MLSGGSDHDADFYQNVLMNLQLFAHGSRGYWMLVTYRAWMGASCGSRSGPPTIQKYINYALIFHAVYDMSNECILNPSDSNGNTALYLALLRTTDDELQLSFNFCMWQYEKLVLTKQWRNLENPSTNRETFISSVGRKGVNA